jgi:hypothetical protein
LTKKLKNKLQVAQNKVVRFIIKIIPSRHSVGQKEFEEVGFLVAKELDGPNLNTRKHFFPHQNRKCGPCKIGEPYLVTFLLHGIVCFQLHQRLSFCMAIMGTKQCGLTSDLNNKQYMP